LPKGNITIGIFTDVLPNENIEWIPTLFGVEIDEWASWTENLNTGLIHYYKMDELGGSMNDSLGTLNLTATNVAYGEDGIINTSYGVVGGYMNTASFPVLTNYTLSFWINASSFNAGTSPFGTILWGGNGFGFVNGGLTGVFTGTSWVDSNTAVTLHEWANIVVVTNTSAGTSFYLNGVADGNTALKYVTEATSTIFGTADTNYDIDAIIDEFMIYNRSLSATEISDYYNGGYPPHYLIKEGIEIDQSFPANNTYTTDITIDFGCNFTGVDGKNITDVTILVYDSGDNLDYTNTESGLNLVSYNKTWLDNALIDDDYKWACYGKSTMFEDYAGNRTFTIDTTVPELTINLPTSQEDYAYVGENELLNWTYTDPNHGSCWYNYNGTIVYVNCTEGNSTFVLEKDNYNMTFYANDSVNNLNTTFFNWTYNVWENSRTFENLTYETATETYQVNVTSNSNLTSTALIYGGTSYASTLSGDTYSTTITHTVNATNEIYWNFTYAGDIFSSYTSNQTVNNTEFNVCNVTSNYLNTTFLNLSFLDEETLVRIGGQIDTSTIEYWIGDGSVTETLVYSNLTNLSEQRFCFTPASETMKNTRTFQYSATGYPQRKYDDDTDLTNTTTHKTLYLLSSTDGIYSTIQVIDENSDIVSGADVTMERQFAGVWTIVGKETTDGAGAVTFWVNPDYDHRFTLEKNGCVTTSATIRPTQTTYTATLDCLGVSDEIYIAPIEGIKYFLLPGSGLITSGEQNFSFQVSSSKDNIVGAKFEIVNLSNYILTSQTSVCAPAGCTISKLYNVSSPDNIKGRYYVDIGSGYILLEADAHWITVNITARDGTFEQFWLNLRIVFDEWHEEGEDTTNTSDFNRIVFIFLFIAIFISVFNKLTGFDSANPGAFLIVLTVITFIGSVAGHPDSGFFSLDNTGFGDWLDNYFVFGIVFMNTIVHWMIVKLGAQR